MPEIISGENTELRVHTYIVNVTYNNLSIDSMTRCNQMDTHSVQRNNFHHFDKLGCKNLQEGNGGVGQHED